MLKVSDIKCIYCGVYPSFETVANYDPQKQYVYRCKHCGSCTVITIDCSSVRLPDKPTVLPTVTLTGSDISELVNFNIITKSQALRLLGLE